MGMAEATTAKIGAALPYGYIEPLDIGRIDGGRILRVDQGICELLWRADDQLLRHLEGAVVAPCFDHVRLHADFAHQITNDTGIGAISIRCDHALLDDLTYTIHLISGKVEHQFTTKAPSDQGIFRQYSKSLPHWRPNFQISELVSKISEP